MHTHSAESGARHRDLEQGQEISGKVIQILKARRLENKRRWQRHGLDKAIIDPLWTSCVRKKVARAGGKGARAKGVGSAVVQDAWQTLGKGEGQPGR